MALHLLEDRGDEAQYRCDCGEVFWSSPCGEDNCRWDEAEKCLKPECPRCGCSEYGGGVVKVDRRTSC